MAIVHFYSRPGCHLCDIMLEQLLPMIHGRAEIEKRDIGSQAAWREKYDIRIPVIEYAGEFVSGYPLDHGAVQAMLARISADSE